MHTLVKKEIRNTTWMVLSFVKEELYCYCEDRTVKTSLPLDLGDERLYVLPEAPRRTIKIYACTWDSNLGRLGGDRRLYLQLFICWAFLSRKFSFSKWEIRSQNRLVQCLRLSASSGRCRDCAESPWTKTGVKTVNLYLDLRLNNDFSTSRTRQAELNVTLTTALRVSKR